jgi:hypothetical protein
MFLAKLAIRVIDASGGDGIAGRLIVRCAGIGRMYILFQHLDQTYVLGKVLDVYFGDGFLVAAMLACHNC